MINLVLDVGNSLIKTAVFDKDNLLESGVYKKLSVHDTKNFLTKYKIDAAILSTVRKHDNKIMSLLRNNCFFIELSYETPVPVTNCYETPQTLGMDRLAGVIGASMHFPGKDILVVDLGTCITYDIITSNKEYLGGSISSGIEMRLKALNNFTGKLPLIKRSDIDYLYGRNTNESILAGIINGTLAEVDGIISRYNQLYSDLQVIICGGDTFFFDKKLKNKIFAFEKLVLYGLNEILKYNVQLQKKNS